VSVARPVELDARASLTCQLPAPSPASASWIAPRVEVARLDGGHDGATRIPVVAAIAEAATCGNADDIFKDIQNAVFTRRQLKFADSRVIHQDAAAWQQMERT